MKTATRIVTVWLDNTSDDKPSWVVDTDLADGGESETVKCFPGTKAGKNLANKFASEYAGRRGLEVRLAD